MKTYYSNVKYLGINCQLIYIDPLSRFFDGREGWVLITFANTDKNKLEELGFEYKKDVYLLETDAQTAAALAALSNEEQRNINSLLKALCVPIVYFICLALLWWVPIHLRIAALNLPENTETVYPTKSEISDVYWEHIEANKVIKCEKGSEYAVEYIKSHNPKWMLWNVDVTDYAVMSDMTIYNFEYDDEYLSLPDSEQKKWVLISYFKMFESPTPIDLVTFIMGAWFVIVLANLIKAAFKQAKGLVT